MFVPSSELGLQHSEIFKDISKMVDSRTDNPEMMAQVAWTLGQSMGKKAIGELFGLHMARPASLVPFFYCAQGSVLVSLV